MFDELRYYVRYGTTNARWPIFQWQLTENLYNYRKINNDLKEQRLLYRIAFINVNIINKLLFVFDIGCQRYAIIMDDKYPEPDSTIEILSDLFDDVKGEPNVLYYSQMK